MKNKYTQHFWALLLILVFARPLVFAADADFETPPSININIDETEDDDEAPPGIDIDINDDDNNDNSTGLKITKHDADPQGFNPAISSTKISYTISATGVIEIKILDNLNQNVATLVSDKKLAAGKYSATWRGTYDNEKDGDIVKSGTYKYRIIAKDPVSGDTEDTAEDELNVIFFDGNEDDDTFDDEFLPPVETEPVDSKQNTAVQVMQNNFKGQTSQTGPGIMIYSVLPIIGFLAARKKIF